MKILLNNDKRTLHSVRIVYLEQAGDSQAGA